MAKHTHGPWRVGIYDLEVVDPDGFSIAMGCDMLSVREGWEQIPGLRHWSERKGEGYLERDPEELRANVRVLAASASLLVACQRYLASIAVPTGYGADLAARLAEGAAALDDMRAAVALALGK